MKIYLDLDRTLFDTDFFLRDLQNLQEKYYIPNDLYNKCSKEVEVNGFNIRKILKKVEKEYNFDKKIYEEVDLLLKKTSKYLYEDTIPFLKAAKEKNYKLILFTKGDYDFQLDKIRNTNLLDYFDTVLTTLKDKGDLDIDYKESIFIDDSPYELDSINKRNPKRIIRIRRENTKYQSIETKKEVENISSLEEIKL